MPEQLSPTAQLEVTLRELAWTVHRRSPARGAAGPIPPSEIVLLKQVIDEPGSTISELATALGLRQPNVSTAVRLLHQRGFVVKEPDATDRRIVRIFATRQGMAENAALARAWTEGLATAFERLGADDRAALDGALAALQELNRLLRAER